LAQAPLDYTGIAACGSGLCRAASNHTSKETIVALTPTLNERAQRLADHLAAQAAALRIGVQTTGNGARILDFGVNVPGGLQAGLGLARVCLSNLAEVSLVHGDVAGVSCPFVQVLSDHPVLACMASQYAGWPISVGDYFAMGSGPMRAAQGTEELFDHIDGREQAPVAVGCLETRKLPDDAVVEHLCAAVKVAPAKLTLLTAPAASLAGNLQVVARSVETCLHKLHELKFDLRQVVSAFGSAPLPPVASDELTAIGRTNDAILYGGRVVLWVNADDDQLNELGGRVPSSAQPDHGEPFAEIFKRNEGEFYKIDPLLFSPAEVVFCNLKSGKSHAYGETMPGVLARSFFGEA
jgi:methenyltetrahydromethanopterin cyclohydrolase